MAVFNTRAGEGDGSAIVVLDNPEADKDVSGGVVVAAVADSNVLLKYPTAMQTPITKIARKTAVFFCCI